MKKLGKKHVLYIGPKISEILTRPVYQTKKGDFAILHTNRRRCYLTPIDPPKIINTYEISYEYEV